MENSINLPPLNGNAPSGDLPVSAAVSKPVEVSNVREENSGRENEAEKSITQAEAEEVVSDINKVVQNLQRDLLFSIDQKNGGTILKVTDRETQETVREIPTEEIRALKQRMSEVSGIIFKDSV